MDESDRPSEINISSISGKRSLPDRTLCVFSSLAVIGLTRTLTLDLSYISVTTNTIYPGATAGQRINGVI